MTFEQYYTQNPFSAILKDEDGRTLSAISKRDSAKAFMYAVEQAITEHTEAECLRINVKQFSEKTYTAEVRLNWKDRDGEAFSETWEMETIFIY